MLKRYVNNWGSVLAVYAKLKRETDVKFKDVGTLSLARDNFYAFYGSYTRDTYMIMGSKFMIIQTEQWLKRQTD